jgi:uncharacterized repeat protein (TIGR01451 family)
MSNARPTRRRAVALLVLALLAVSPIAGPSPAGADGSEAPGSPAPFRALSAGNQHTCAILSDGSVRCWGDNGAGQLGLGNVTDRGDGPNEMGTNLPAVDLGAGRTATTLAAGVNHTCAILDTGAVKCWGLNNLGQLGLGNNANRGDQAGEMGDALPAVELGPGRTAIAIAAGTVHTCAILDDHSTRCWGGNGGGQLGLGDTSHRGDGAGEMGSALPAVDLGPGRSAVQITGGMSHTCAVLDDGTVKCWGDNAQGQLGQGDVLSRGDNAGEMGAALTPVNLGTGRTAVAIAAGQLPSNATATCAVLDNGAVKCWGGGSSGRLGLGNATNRGDNPNEMGDNLPAVNLGAGRTARAVSAGGNFACAVLDDGTVKCWGAGAQGQTGLGATNTTSAPTSVADLGPNRTAVAIATGSDHTCARLDNTSVKCWGSGFAGALGQGDAANRGDNSGEMGAALPTVDLGGPPPPPRVRATITSDPGRVSVGEEIDYEITVANAGLVDLTDLQLYAPDVPACAAEVPDLPANASHVIECSHTATAADVPVMVNQVLVTTGEGAMDLSGHARTRVDDAGAAALEVLILPDQNRVIAGQTIGWEITVTNAGTIPLTGVRIHAPDVLDCSRTVGDLAVDQTAVVECTGETNEEHVPLTTNQVQVSSDQGATALSGTRRVRVDPQVLRPDAHIRLGAGAFAGNGTYNTTGAGQTRTATVPNLGAATFTVRIENDGNVSDIFRVTGQPTTARYTVTYRDGPTNVTGQVQAGNHEVGPLAPGDTHDLTVVVKARPGTPVGNVVTRAVTVASGNEPSVKDVVKVTVRRR